MYYKQRTVTCGELRAKDDKKEVVLNGWVAKSRNHGALQFVNLRDRYGVTQVVFDDKLDKKIKEVASSLKMEYVVSITGIVHKRPDDMINKNMPTGEIEVEATDVQILNTCETLPFMIEDQVSAKEDLRLQYRYLDLRSKGMQDRMKLRHDFIFAIREHLVKKGFYEIETPTLIKSTPEGARDFVVPSRVYPGKFYALPQSPQLFKQILMVGQMDKYFQIARCYRDEDARGDRQLEFTQLDMEMTFVSREDIFLIIEDLFHDVFKKVINYKTPKHFTRLSYFDAMNTYGCDKPDLRFDLKIQDFSSLAKLSSFELFKTTKNIKALVAPSSDKVNYSRKYLDSLTEAAKVYGVSGLAYLKVNNKELSGSVAKYFTGLEEKVIKETKAKDGDIILISCSDNWKKCCTSLGAVRNKLASDLDLIDPDRFEFCWIIDFPLFEFNEEENHWEAAHHMFSMPQSQYLDTLEENPGEVKGDLYDLVLNGYEVASGSIRIHDPKLQKRIFKICNFDEKEAEERFGFLLNAFRYGAPPHGGIAPGIDRMVMIMSKQNSIREVIAFPKNTASVSPMEDSPSYIDKSQMDELHLIIRKDDEKN